MMRSYVSGVMTLNIIILFNKQTVLHKIYCFLCNIALKMHNLHLISRPGAACRCRGDR